jgi:GDPmannose 4,6-dehydratase
MFASNGILFNHESPLRGETFVTRKITRAACKIALGLQSTLFMGNLDAKRDWGHAKDYVRAMWLILQHSIPDDFVVATGVTTTVREFLLKSFERLGIVIAFKGKDVDEVGYVKSVTKEGVKVKVGDVIVKIDPVYFRPTEVELLIGNPAKIRKATGWEPEYDLNGLVADMVDADYELFRREAYLLEGGHKILRRAE